MERDSEDGPAGSGAWGWLTPMSSDRPTIALTNSSLLFGRNKECDDVSRFTDQKISSRHCRLVREGTAVYLEDLSTNGTYLNGNKIGKGQRERLSNKDEIALGLNGVKRVGDFVAYVFHLDSEMIGAVLGDEPTLADTDLAPTLSDDGSDEPCKDETESHSAESAGAEIVSKKRKGGDRPLDALAKKRHVATSPSEKAAALRDHTTYPYRITRAELPTRAWVQLGEIFCDEADDGSETVNIEWAGSPEEATMAWSSNCNLEGESGVKCEPPGGHGFAGFDAARLVYTRYNCPLPENEHCMRVVVKPGSLPLRPALAKVPSGGAGLSRGVEPSCKGPVSCPRDVDFSGVPPRIPTTDDADRMKQLEDKVGSSLTCGICCDLLYKCVSVMPCLHNFCACCYSEWRERSDKCPECRVKVTSLARNHAICSLIDTLLEADPGKARDPEELKEMDERSKLTDVQLREGVNYGEEAPTSGLAGGSALTPPGLPFVGGLRAVMGAFGGIGAWGPSPLVARSPMCRGCSTTLDGWTCTSATTHLLCSQCGRHFPQRTDIDFKYRCELCSQIFCNNVFPSSPCSSFRGASVLIPLADYSMTVLPGGCLNRNAYEQEILRAYLTINELDPDTVYHDMLEEVDEGAVAIPEWLGVSEEVTPSSHACVQCAEKVFCGLLYAFRERVDGSDLPADVVSRGDCHWGRACRTQFHNTGHQKRFNHICEQTRFG